MLDDLTLARLQASALVLGSDVLADALLELRTSRERIRDLEAALRQVHQELQNAQQQLATSHMDLPPRS